MTDLLRHIMRAGEAGRCGAGCGLVLDFEDFEMARASFFDEAGAALEGLEGCAVVDTRSLPPSDDSFPCLFFFLVMLGGQGQEAMAPEGKPY